MSAKLQEWIHFIEEGGGAKLLRAVLVAVGFLAIALLYNFFAYKTFHTEEAMDTAQLARNISEGKGYTTDYIRLSSFAILQAHANEELTELQGRSSGLSEAEKSEQRQLIQVATLKAPHPDLANAPVYPTLLAGLMKLAPMKFEIPKKPFRVYAPEMWIGIFNQILFFIAILVLYGFTSRLFDRATGAIAALLFGATELIWRFSISGLPVLLLIVIFLCLAWVMMRFEATDEDTPLSKIFVLSALAGLLLGLGALTRYSFGWLVFPVLIFIGWVGTEHRVKAVLITLGIFLIALAPWLIRNNSISGNLFGTATSSIFEATPSFQDNLLDRSLDADKALEKVSMVDYVRKFMHNSRELIQTEIPRIGATWLTPLFLAGLLIPLPRRAQSRLRIFVLLCLAFLGLAFIFGRGHLALESPQINTENLLIVLTPLVIAFAVAVYFNLLNRLTFSEPALSKVITAAFCLLISAPLVFAILPPRMGSSAFPPYHPPLIQEASNWMRQDELMMSDVPWAVAWYGDRQCLALSQNVGKDFLQMTDDVRPIQAVYLSPRTTDSRFIFQMVREPQGWGRFVLEVMTKGEPPATFPLRKVPVFFLPDHLMLTDWERWPAPSVSTETK